MELGDEFVQADSRNLPEVNTLMILEYIQTSNNHSIDEIREVKRLAASEENYIIDAVGFVKVKKDDTESVVEAKVVALEEVEQKYCTVSVHVNEQENTIVGSACNCQANLAGGCTHTLLFLCWLENKSSIPERAPVQCFWHEPLLGMNYSMRIKDIFKFRPSRNAPERGPRDPAVLEAFLKECKKRKLTNSLIMLHSPS